MRAAQQRQRHGESPLDRYIAWLEAEGVQRLKEWCRRLPPHMVTAVVTEARKHPSRLLLLGLRPESWYGDTLVAADRCRAVDEEWRNQTLDLNGPRFVTRDEDWARVWHELTDDDQWWRCTDPATPLSPERVKAIEVAYVKAWDNPANAARRARVRTPEARFGAETVARIRAQLRPHPRPVLRLVQASRAPRRHRSRAAHRANAPPGDDADPGPSDEPPDSGAPLPPAEAAA